MPAASSNLPKDQQELLFTLQHLQLSERQWFELRQLIVQYLGNRLIETVDQVVEAKGWKDEDFERMLHDHQRVSYE